MSEEKIVRRPLYRRSERSYREMRDTCEIDVFLADNGPATREDLNDLRVAIDERRTVGVYAAVELPNESSTNFIIFGPVSMLYLDPAEKQDLLKALAEYEESRGMRAEGTTRSVA